MRLIVMGERDWEDRDAVEWALEDRLSRYHYSDVTIVHGACPTGADKFADEWARSHGIEVVTFPADWTKLGKQAGPIRNTAMADSGAGDWLAFWSGRIKNSGTFDAFHKCVLRGIGGEVVPRRT